MRFLPTGVWVLAICWMVITAHGLRHYLAGLVFGLGGAVAPFGRELDQVQSRPS